MFIARHLRHAYAERLQKHMLRTRASTKKMNIEKEAVEIAELMTQMDLQLTLEHWVKAINELDNHQLKELHERVNLLIGRLES